MFTLESSNPIFPIIVETNVMYEVAIEASFSAAHFLRNYRGKCENLHGHNWKVEVTVDSDGLDEIGMLIDFKVLKEKTRIVIDQLDHCHLNELPAFTQLNPSSENIAYYLFTQLKKELEGERVRLRKVTVWESEESKATYYE
jgi:6-pyruvoyltetrahydropterin/6-carboxytetrahydropterin synthase